MIGTLPRRAGSLGLLVLLLAVRPLPAGAADDVEAALADWAAVLATRVDADGRIDFAGLAADRAALDRYVDWIGRVSPLTSPALFPGAADVLAYHLNAYNALAMHGVIETGIPKAFGSVLARASFFRLRTVTVGGRPLSLHAYENDVIRPLGDARAHFALNCMVRDCPRLPQVPFRAPTLDAQLDSAAREFFASPRHLRIDTEARVVWLSAILDFYTEDFVASGAPDDLPAYVNRYRETPLPAGYRVRFAPYDWTINRQ